MAHVLNTTGCWECCQLSTSAWKSERHNIRRELKTLFNYICPITSFNNTWPHENVHPAHLRGVRRTAGQLLEQLQQREEALEDDAVRNVQSTQLQQEDRLHQHHSQRSYRDITKRQRMGTRALGPKYRLLLWKHSFFIRHRMSKVKTPPPSWEMPSIHVITRDIFNITQDNVLYLCTSCTSSLMDYITDACLCSKFSLFTTVQRACRNQEVITQLLPAASVCVCVL